ncbi:cytochrome C oxidase subunit II [Candidatus Woesearchaeota archaeon]|nr:MAG: cytochrome C oxidase subunit II [Candidatus Woesearchaeota archaeon]
MKKITISCIIAVLLLALVSCSSQKEAKSVAWSGEVKKFNIRAFQFGYEPDTIEVNLGDKVVINAHTSDVPHGLALPDFGVNMKLTGEDSVRAEFIADKAGEFEWYCSIPCGRGHGSMRGKLIVRDVENEN